MASSIAASTWEHLVQFHRIATTAMDDSLRTSCGHSLDEYDVLHQMHSHGKPIRMGALAERLLIANSSCNRMVGRLVEAGFIARVHGENDRRNVLVQLTTEGRRLRRRMAVAHTRDINRLVGTRLSTSALADLDAALGTLLSEVAGKTAVAPQERPSRDTDK
jgi:DNA-binding MarR family transcriptional regulator